MAKRRKQYLLRIPQELYDIYETWAADEFRSVNAQIEATLVEAARRAGRYRRSPPATSAGGEEPAGESADQSAEASKKT